MTPEPGADRRQLLVPVPDRSWPGALVLARDRRAGRLYICPCGWRGWSAFGRAHQHREACPMTPTTPTITDAQERALAFLERAASLGVTPRRLADHLWPPDPDSPQTTRRTVRRDGRAGALRATYPMLAGKLLRRMLEAGLVWPQQSIGRYCITDAGRRALERARGR